MIAEVAAIIFIATIFRTTFGFGEALIAVPLLSLFLPVKVAAPLAVLASIVIALAAVIRDWKHIHFSEAKKLLLATAVGLPFGLLALRFVPESVVKIALGCLLFLFSLFSLLRPQFFFLADDRWVSVFGFFAGVSGGSYGMNGPPLVIYGAARRWSPERFRATLQAYFLPASLLGMVGYLISGLWTKQVNGIFVSVLPVILVGIMIGRFLNRRTNSALFVKALHVALLVIAGLLILQSLR
jgi:uncharacterized membrane protein YfcA